MRDLYLIIGMLGACGAFSSFVMGFFIFRTLAGWNLFALMVCLGIGAFGFHKTSQYEYVPPPKCPTCGQIIHEQ